MPGIKAAILDWDGTLADSAGPIIGCWLEAFGRYGISVSRDWLLGMQGMSTKKTLRVAVPSPSLRKEVAGHYSSLTEEAYRKSRLFPGARQLLAHLRKSGLKIALVSAGTGWKVRRRVRSKGLSSGFDLIMGKGDYRGEKISGSPFRAACRRLGVKPAETISIGDAVPDVLGSKRAGCLMIAVTNGFQKRKPLADAGADFVVRDLAQAKKAVRRILLAGDP